MKKIVFQSFFVFFAIVFIVGCASMNSPMVPVIRLEGEPGEIGKQHGIALKKEIQTLYYQYLLKIANQRGVSEARLIEMATERYKNNIPLDLQLEMHGIAEGSELKFEQILVANCFLEILKIPQCSLIGVPSSWNPNQEVIIARNLDFPALGILNKSSVIFEVFPKGKIPFVSVSWPSLCGNISAMNQEGLTMSMAEVGSPHENDSGIPYSLLYRMMLESCKDAKEAKAFLEKNQKKITTTHNLILADAKREVQIWQLRPNRAENIPFEKDSLHFAINSFRGTPEYQKDQRAKLLELFCLSEDKPIHKNLYEFLDQLKFGKMNIQSMLFYPERKAIVLATGLPATQSSFHLHPVFSTNPKK